MVTAAIAAGLTTPLTTMPAITAVWSVEDDVDSGAGALVEAAEVVKGLVEEIIESLVEEDVEESMEEGAVEVAEVCWIGMSADSKREPVEEATDAMLDAVEPLVLEYPHIKR